MFISIWLGGIIFFMHSGPSNPIHNDHQGLSFSASERQKVWETVHTEQDYDSVWSLTDDIGVRQKVVSELLKLPNHQRILIPGCGSKVFMQNQIATDIPDIEEVICTDYPKVVAVAETRTDNDKISYLGANSTALPWRSYFNAVLVMNSVLSDSDQENIDMLKSFYQSLKPGGSLIGFFPTVYCALDFAHLLPSNQAKEMLELIDLDHSTEIDPGTDMKQIFYTPLELRARLLAADFKLKSMEIYFCDSEHFQAETEKFYNIRNPNLVTYEHFVIATKPFD